MKHILKFAVSWCCRLLILPLLAIVRLMEIFIHTDQPFQFGAHTVSLIPGFLGNYFRKEYYRLTLKRCDADICVEFGTILHQASVELGRRVYIGTNCSIGECMIDDDAMIGSNVDIISGRNQHNFGQLDMAIREQGGSLTPIVIGTDCWIGNSAVVMASVGEKSIVGAGSVVVDDIEPYAIVAGNPARLLRKRPGYVRKVSGG
ncbi:MAG: acyltransferase [Deltaproteobacteria bacterium]|nr:acyltransferase [Deltaproteobacteria bacterium]